MSDEITEAELDRLEQLEQLEQLEREATPGKWRWEPRWGWRSMSQPNGGPIPDDSEAQGAIVTADGTVVCDFGNTAEYYNTAGTEPDEKDWRVMIAARNSLTKLIAAAGER